MIQPVPTLCHYRSLPIGSLNKQICDSLLSEKCHSQPFQKFGVCIISVKAELRSCSQAMQRFAKSSRTKLRLVRQGCRLPARHS